MEKALAPVVALLREILSALRSPPEGPVPKRARSDPIEFGDMDSDAEPSAKRRKVSRVVGEGAAMSSPPAPPSSPFVPPAVAALLDNEAAEGPASPDVSTESGASGGEGDDASDSEGESDDSSDDFVDGEGAGEAAEEDDESADDSDDSQRSIS